MQFKTTINVLLLNNLELHCMVDDVVEVVVVDLETWICGFLCANGVHDRLGE